LFIRIFVIVSFPSTQGILSVPPENSNSERRTGDAAIFVMRSGFDCTKSKISTLFAIFKLSSVDLSQMISGDSAGDCLFASGIVGTDSGAVAGAGTGSGICFGGVAGTDSGTTGAGISASEGFLERGFGVLCEFCGRFNVKPALIGLLSLASLRAVSSIPSRLAILA